MLRVQRVNNGVLPLVMGVLLHDRSCRFVRAEKWRHEWQRKDKEECGMIRVKRRRVEGCVWVLSTISLIFLRTETNFCVTRVNVYVCTRCIGALSTHYFRYGEREIWERENEKKKKHTTFHLHFLLLADLYIHIYIYIKLHLFT